MPRSASNFHQDAYPLVILSYWRWPSRNSWFIYQQWGFSSSQAVSLPGRVSHQYLFSRPMEPLIPAVLRHNVTGGAKRSGLQCSSVWLGHRHVLDWDQPSGPNMACKKIGPSQLHGSIQVYWSTIFADVWPCLGPTSVRKLREVKLAENLWHSTCNLADWHVACPAVVFLSMESLLSSIDFGWGGLVASHFDDYLHIFHCWHHDSRDRFVSSLLVSRIPTMIGCSLTPRIWREEILQRNPYP